MSEPGRLMPAINKVARAALRLQGGHAGLRTARGNVVHLVEMPGKGSGPPVILLHGLGSSGLTFSRLIPEIAAWSRVVYAADLPGAGFSPTPNPALPLVACVEVLIELYRNELRGEKALVMGNSLGGAMAALMAVNAPDVVGQLAMVAPAGGKVAPHRQQALLASFQMKRWVEGRDFLRRLYHRAPPLIPELLGMDMVQTFASAATQELLGGDRPSDFLEPELLAMLKMPLLLLWGRSERVLPYEGIEHFREHLPKHAVIEEVDGFGHVPHLETPTQLSERLRLFSESSERVSRTS